MNEEIKTEDIIKSLRECVNGICRNTCVNRNVGIDRRCDNKLVLLAADRLEQIDNRRIKAQHNNEDYVPVVKSVANPMPPDKSAALKARIEKKQDESYEQKIMQRAIEYHGVLRQCDRAMKEMAELIAAIIEIRRVADDYEKTQTALDNLLEEIADVDIMIDQMKIMWGPKHVEEYRRKKLERLEKRLEEKEWKSL